MGSTKAAAMAYSTVRLQGLIDLAQEDSSDKRRELLEEVADLFLDDSNAMNDRETGLADDILTKVAHDVEMKVRKSLAERFASVDTVPPNLVRMLASDEIEVAAPILQESRALSDRDLMDIVRENGKDHMLAVTRREEISEAVSEALVESGDDDVIVNLVRNAGAQISRGSMENLVARSESNAVLQEPLVKRGDLPADLMHDMFWFVSSQLKEYILTEADMDESLVAEVIEETRASLTQEIDDYDAKMRRGLRIVLRRERERKLNEDYMVQALRQGEREVFVAAFSRLAEIDLQTADRVLSNESPEAIAVACKASQFMLSTFSSIVLLSNEGKTRKGFEVAELLELYNKVPDSAAKRAMRFWRIRKKAESAPKTAPMALTA